LIPTKQGENGAPGPTRTGGLLLRRQLLYPAELQAQLCFIFKAQSPPLLGQRQTLTENFDLLVGARGFEPSTQSLITTHYQLIVVVVLNKTGYVTVKYYIILIFLWSN
jgi:hypothetical protein